MHISSFQVKIFVEKTLRLSISNDMWILLSDTIVSLTNYFQIVRRQRPLPFSHKSNTAVSRRFVQKLPCLMHWKKLLEED